MRMNLTTQPTEAPSRFTRNVPVALTLKPSYGLPGEYVYSTDSSSLIRLLSSATDLAVPDLRRFEKDMFSNGVARLSGVNVSDSVLETIGYFID